MNRKTSKRGRVVATGVLLLLIAIGLVQAATAAPLGGRSTAIGSTSPGGDGGSEWG